MQNRVLSGDSKNLEAQAARIYWKKLLGKEFPEILPHLELTLYLTTVMQSLER